ncbi:unnamed protein product [Nezara viridula]|uniref:malate dehydrogenase n=1 Tax=Nezara viridula TaxID=85310 RepID=A0A9P0H0E7_NEZVI|nr:unnamed protein product [Nezara viridula]
MNTPCRVEAYQGKTKLNDAIKGSDIVLIGDDIFSTPQTCFDVMAPKMQDYAKAISESSPNALIIVAASPINKLVPVLSELLQENGYYDCNRVVGTTSFHNIRANCILASYINTDPRSVFLPVVGGDSEDTIVPLFSQAKPHFNISEVMRF